MRYLKLIAPILLLFAWALPAQAAQIKGLYEAEVEVADQSRESRATAMAEAMAAVLLKVSGSSAVLGEEVIQNAMADAARYVQQYRYRTEAIVEEKRTPAEEDKAAQDSRLLLWVGFDSASIDNLLRRFGFTVWSPVRPTVLVWLGVEEGARRVLVGSNDQGLVREVLDSESNRRALPLRLPLLDLKDQSGVRPVDIWGGFYDAIEVASQRYEPQALLIGKLYPVGQRWEARWVLRYQGEQYDWQHNSDDVTAVVASGVGGSSDYLSRHFAAASIQGMEQLALRIVGVKTMGDFRRVNDYLRSLHGVTALKLRRTDANSSSFHVELKGGQDAVLQAIDRGDVLVKVEQVSPEAVPLPGFSLSASQDDTPQQQSQSLQSQGGVEEAGGAAANGEMLQETGATEPQQVQPQELVYRLLS